MTGAVIACFIIGAGYLLLCAVKPLRRCPRCTGRKVVSGRRGNMPCPRCRGRGLTPRAGAATVLSLLNEYLGPWLRERLRDRRER